MPDEDGAQAGLIVELRFEGKNAEHEVEALRHLRDAAAIPRPDLRADVVDDFQLRQFSAERAGQAEIEAGIIDQHHRIDFLLADVAQRGRKLPPEVSIFLQHLPQPEHRGVPAPISHASARRRAHPRSTPAGDNQFGLQIAQRGNQGRAMRVTTGLARDEVKTLRPPRAGIDALCDLDRQFQSGGGLKPGDARRVARGGALQEGRRADL